jgi:hypothetical protein
MAKSAFQAPLRGFMVEAAWLETEFLGSAANRLASNAQLTCEMAVIRLHDAWARLCRELVIMSAAGDISTLSGTWLSPSIPAIKNRADVIPHLLSTYKKRIFEPRWASPSDCLEAAQKLRIQNLPTLSAAVGALNSPAETMRNVRNFYAHRSKETCRKALATGCFSTSSRPLVFDLASYKPGGETIIESWISGLCAVADAATQ